MDLLDVLVNIAGLAMIILVTYMVVRNVVQPRFFFPWMRGREKERLLERGEWLLAEADLNADERERVQSAINTLTMRRGGGESWTREDPFNAARTDINNVWLVHGAGERGEDSVQKAQ